MGNGTGTGDGIRTRLVDKSLMVPRGDIVELCRCSREITALARTAGCPTSTLKWDRDVVNVRGPVVGLAVSQ